MTERSTRVGLVGAGYIARWHAEALARLPGVELVAVADPAPAAARALAEPRGARVHASLDDMLAETRPEAVHILTPPPLHAAQAIAALGAGAHVLVEKPFALTGEEAAAMAAAAQAAGRVLAVNHNFLGLPAYARLKARVAAGDLGRIDRLTVNWHYPLPPLRSGPFGLWLLRSPQNLLTEFAPHLFAFVQDLLGPAQDLVLRPGRWIDLPGGARLPQSLMAWARAGTAEVTISISLVEGDDDRSLTLRGVAGAARLDFAADTLIVQAPNSADIVLNPLMAQLSLAGQHLRQGLGNAWRQGRSLNRDQPYALGFRTALGAFHTAIRQGGPVDARFSADAAVAVTQAIDRARALLPAPAPAPQPPAAVADGPVQALVIGGTGFIGRALTRALVAAGVRVRVLSRGRANPFADLGDAVEILSADPADTDALARAMAGVGTVYHLARAEEATWDAYLQNDVAVTERIGAAALAAGVGRLVYTGTIASYDASDPRRPITEDTPFGPMEARNLYARSKALCEDRLLALHRDRGLPLVIARPGIVIGPGGPLQHWGIGRWQGPGAVRLWGDGRNPLPLVLIDDVAEALVRMGRFDGLPTVEGIEGQSFNLVGPPILSARGYFDAIHRLTGTRIRLRRGRLNALYLADLGKWLLKRHVLRKPGVIRPSRADWLSRGALSPFVPDRACAVLGWQPETDPDRLARRAIDGTALFGF
ncbi:MAG: NAD-dependent epimerase/dehydratase family protein [Rhodobacterales bacterium]|nr:NAD-dependent epimerase/dehydratase family protein [Rhodobacterales bacterium]